MLLLSLTPCPWAAHDRIARAGGCVGPRAGLCTEVHFLQVCDGKSLVQKLEMALCSQCSVLGPPLPSHLPPRSNCTLEAEGQCCDLLLSP